MPTRDKGGRFAKGNGAARGRKQRKRTTAELIEAVEAKLTELGEKRGVDEFVALTVIQILRLAAGGNLKAAIWVMERFYPGEREPHMVRVRLPSPTKKPSQYRDALVRAFSRGELTSGQVTRLANLATSDDLVRQLTEALERALATTNTLRVVK